MLFNENMRLGGFGRGGDRWTYVCIYVRTYGRTSGNSPLVLQDIGPLGPLPKNEKKMKKKGKK